MFFRLAPEKYITKKKQSDTYYVIVMAILLAPVSVKKQISPFASGTHVVLISSLVSPLVGE